MPFVATCPDCQAEHEYPRTRLGDRVECHRCGTTFLTAELPKPPSSPRPPRPRNVRGDDPDYDPAERASRRKSPAQKSKVVVAFSSVVGILVAVAVSFAVKSALNGRWSRSMDWQAFEAPDRCRAQMPGKPTSESKNEGGIDMVMHKVEPDRHTAFAVGYTIQTVPGWRLNAGPEVILNDSCDGAVENLKKMGGTELSRTSIKLDNVPGKQVVVGLPNKQGKLIMRVHLHAGRLYMALAGGRDYDKDHADVKKFFDSFEIIEPQGLKQPPVQKAERRKEFEPAGKTVDPPLMKREVLKVDPPSDFNKQPPRQVPFENNPPPPREIAPKANPLAARRLAEASEPDEAVIRDAPAPVELKFGVAYLDNLPEFGWKEGKERWALGKNGQLGDPQRPDLKVNSGLEPVRHALSMYPPVEGYARVCYSLGGKGKRFTAKTGYSKHAVGAKSDLAGFVVLGDGKVLWSSKIDGTSKAPGNDFVSVDLAGVNVLELRVFSLGETNENCHAVWIDPRVLCVIQKK